MPQPSVDVSVIVATYNQLASTRLALQALFAQRTDCSYDVILCDDGSNRETVDGLLEALEAAPVPAYLVWQQDRGFRLSASRNNGIRSARGRILVFLDGDLVPESDFVDVHFRGHQHAQTIAVGKRLWRIPEAVQGMDLDADALWSVLRREDAIDRRSRIVEAIAALLEHWAKKPGPHRPASWTSCHGCNFSVSKSSLVEFDESMVGWGFEDLDLAYALSVVHGFEVTHIQAIAYEVQGWVDRGETWQQSDYIAHLCNGFRLLDKWAHTGMTAEQAIPRHTLDPETGLWSMTPYRRRRNRRPVDQASIRQWLIERGHLPSVGGASSQKPSPAE
jgi:glycosyltransferase involved in cell wall biosynthesis